MSIERELTRIGNYLRDDGWFESGAHIIVDGQFGSTGKGALASFLAFVSAGDFRGFVTNAGPNSGHTARLVDVDIVTKQVPIGAACYARWGWGYDFCYMNGGSIIDLDTLESEVGRFLSKPVTVHPCAAIIQPYHVNSEAHDGSSRVAGTGKGVGAALADKVKREGNLAGLMNPDPGEIFMKLGTIDFHDVDVPYLVETPQGFSLGINEARFAPFTTSRECTVQQAMADARIPLCQKHRVAMSIRTYPIRVGNTDKGKSGDCYPDQYETTWDRVGVKAETTTVTGRERRVFTFSETQLIEALRVNRPDLVFVNFLNYIHEEDDQKKFVRRVHQLCLEQLLNPIILCGFGPHINDVALWRPR